MFPSQFQVPAAIVAKLNEVFEPQAGVHFELADAGIVDRPFDRPLNGDSNGILDAELPSGINSELQEGITIRNTFYPCILPGAITTGKNFLQ